ncbi:hypothetical protein [Curtobacterium sp. MCJR17_043]|nr:hypothetical protein [Curtobacterium sp. MCJR17_043]WIB36651.1 hypothetical protein DEJ15_06045 [Curtobacterium sp. MCJR17_043]
MLKTNVVTTALKAAEPQSQSAQDTSARRPAVVGGAAAVVGVPVMAEP